MSDPFTLEIDNRPIVLVLAAAAAFQLTTAPIVQPNLTIVPNPIVSVSIPAPVQPIVQIVTQQPIMQVNLATGGIRGLTGPPGPTGQRGSLLLGLYAAPVNLPTPTNDGLFPGDYAFTADGTLYQIES
jgi:hypothetical protein